MKYLFPAFLLFLSIFIYLRRHIGAELAVQKADLAWYWDGLPKFDLACPMFFFLFFSLLGFAMFIMADWQKIKEKIFCRRTHDWVSIGRQDIKKCRMCGKFEKI